MVVINKFKDLYRLCIITIALYLLTTALYGQEINITAKVSSAKVAVGSTFEYEVIISGEYEVIISGKNTGNIPKPELPDFQGNFINLSSYHSTSYSWDNGKMAISKTNRYILQAVKEGDFIIKPAEVNFNNQRIKTNAIRIQILPANTTANVSTTSTRQRNIIQLTPQRQNTNSNVIIYGKVNKQTAYVGEQIIYEARFLSRIHLWSNIQYETPEFKNFITENLETKKGKSLVSVENRKYHSFELAKKALFPLETGQFSIKPARVSFVANFFDGEQVLASQPLSLNIIPLPQKNKPADFSGLVGDFSLTANTSKLKTDRNSPITVRIKLSGEGNLKSVSDLLFNTTTNLKIYKSKVEDEIKFADKVTGTRTFEYIVIPKISGRLAIPSFNIHFFDPQKKDYILIKTESVPFESLEVKTTEQTTTKTFQQKTDIEVLQKDILYLKSPLYLERKSKYLFDSILFRLLILLNIVLLMYSIISILFKKFYIKNEARKKKQKAYNTALQSFSRLSRNIESDTGAVSKLQNIFLTFLSNKTGVSFYGLTKAEMATVLEKNNLDKRNADSCLDIMEKLAFTVYAPSKVSIEDKKIIFETTAAQMKNLKKWDPDI
ncbi:MAG: protein BatD [bacterium]|nr:protein BatD [bacterium]